MNVFWTAAAGTSCNNSGFLRSRHQDRIKCWRYLLGNLAMKDKVSRSTEAERTSASNIHVTSESWKYMCNIWEPALHVSQQDTYNICEAATHMQHLWRRKLGRKSFRLQCSSENFWAKPMWMPMPWLTLKESWSWLTQLRSVIDWKQPREKKRHLSRGTIVLSPNYIPSVSLLTRKVVLNSSKGSHTGKQMKHIP